MESLCRARSARAIVWAKAWICGPFFARSISPMANGHDAPWWVNALKWTAEKMGVAAIVLAFIGAGTWYAGSWLGGFVDRAYDDLAKPIAI